MSVSSQFAEPAHPWRFSVPELVLVLITVVWGTTFLIVQHALTVTGPFFFVGLRFATAALLLGVTATRTMAGVTWLDLRAGSLIGVVLMLGYSLQTVGLKTIPSSQSAFITALYVPFVPLLQLFFLRRVPQPMAWIGVVLAFTGLVLLAGPEGASISFEVGELWTLASAVAIAGEIILIGAFAGKAHARRVTVVQLGVASLLSFAAMIPAGESIPPFSWLLVATAVGLGLASALIQFAMNWAQRTVSPTRATLIYAGEPVWAGIFGRIAGERLGPIAILGAALIVLGVLVSELRWKRR
ncbi:drug/metabolite transporter (DMT)-like permease [Pseudochelatococcus lubricantis]|uniref:Drug/metabolite transporter (DMT)-like permease n=1 Tax=Pseudochelatococcus lubricantis TaxID=1538102 RepID=A0ABX0UZZ6_9HYPH|nr:DMT family transporter [Pseudochelatococcus lubricantis]NIJ58478.1 drug/metabolite transporter (DMT)-like permease [Pseudochelatococcus lubricantis]